MKIAVNTRFLLKGKLEGIGWFTYEVLKRLVKAHPEHEFIFCFDRPYDRSFLFGNNVHPLVISPPARHAILWWYWFEVALPGALKKYRPDVFLSPDGYCSLRMKTPTVMVMHDMAYLHYPEQIPLHGRVFYRHFTPKYLERADRIVSVSSYTKSDILQHFLIDPAKIKIACNGCRDIFHPLDDISKKEIKDKYANGQDYFLFVGAVHPRKNVDRLIKAFDRFKAQSNAPTKLLIGGRRGWQTEEVQKAYDQALFKKDIVFLGYLNEQVLPDLVASAIALVYVSLFEGFGVPLLEAMHAEVPIITSNTSSMPEVAGEAAIKVTPTNIDSICLALQEVYEKADLRNQLVEHGKKQRELFSWEKAAGVIWENLEEVSRLTQRQTTKG